MSTPQQEDIKTTYRKAQASVQERKGSIFGEMLGLVLYLISWHQILHCIAFAANASSAPLSVIPLSGMLPWGAQEWLSWFIATAFPGNVDVQRQSIPLSMHVGEPQGLSPVFINALLFVPLILQHSFMARLPFKRKLLSFLPRWAERFIYTFLTALAFQTLFYFWQAMPTPVWNFAKGSWLEYPISMGLHALWTGGVLWCLAAMYSSTSRDIFGYREACTGVSAKPIPDNPGLMFRLCRHPLFFGILLCLWTTPIMTQGRLFLAIVMTLYTLIAAKWQEADLLNRFGRKYADYKQQVPFLIPSFAAL